LPLEERRTVKPVALLIMIEDVPVENTGMVKYSFAAMAASRLTPGLTYDVDPQPSRMAPSAFMPLAITMLHADNAPRYGDNVGSA